MKVSEGQRSMAEFGCAIVGLSGSPKTSRIRRCVLAKCLGCRAVLDDRPYQFFVGAWFSRCRIGCQ